MGLLDSGEKISRFLMIGNSYHLKPISSNILTKLSLADKNWEYLVPQNLWLAISKNFKLPINRSYQVSQQVLDRNLAKKSLNVTKSEKTRESLFTFWVDKS